MNTVRCDCCGNLTYYSDDMKKSDTEYHSGKPYKVEYIECPECGSNIYFVDEYREFYEGVLEKSKDILHKLKSLRDVVIRDDEEDLSKVKEDNLLYILESDDTSKPTKLGFKIDGKLYVLKYEEEQE